MYYKIVQIDKGILQEYIKFNFTIITQLKQQFTICDIKREFFKGIINYIINKSLIVFINQEFLRIKKSFFF